MGNRVDGSAPCFPTSPGIDNCVKFFLDAIQGIAFPDNCGIVAILAVKTYATADHVGKALIACSP
eukprot:7980145-Ditylum_brightwellii.AAC.1